MDKDLLLDCCYCSKNLTLVRWESSWYDDRHYISTLCECGKKNWQEVIMGSGHHSSFKKTDLGSILRGCCEATWSN